MTANLGISKYLGYNSNNFVIIFPTMKKESFETNPTIITEPDIQELIKDRSILEEDFHLLEQLANFPKIFFIEFHNFFNLLKDRSVSQLENDITHQKDNDKKKFLELLLDLTKKYDWTVSWNLVRVFEKRNNHKL